MSVVDSSSSFKGGGGKYVSWKCENIYIKFRIINKQCVFFVYILHVRMYLCAHVCMCELYVYAFVCTCCMYVVYVFAFVCTFVNMLCVHVCLYMYGYIYMHMYMYICV